MAVPEPTFSARYLSNISVVFADDTTGTNAAEYRDAVQSFQFVPATPIATTKGGTAKSVWTATGNATWTLNVKFLQDLESTGSLQNYLLVNAGKVKRVTFTPSGGKTVSADVILASPPLGGDVESYLDGTISMGVRGAPVVA